MTPKKLMEWSLAITFAVGLWVIVGLILFRIVFDGYDIVEAKSAAFRSNPAFMIVLNAAVIASVVVFLFRSASGALKFKILGAELSGPSGQVTLWSAVFLVISAVFVPFYLH